jgi:uncharacterized protein YgiM (DUF1202 family)
VIAVEGARLRAGPGTVYRILTSYARGTELEVLGRSPSGNWLLVASPNGVHGWISMELVSTGIEVDELPRVKPPPTPFPTATPRVKDR